MKEACYINGQCQFPVFTADQMTFDKHLDSRFLQYLVILIKNLLKGKKFNSKQVFWYTINVQLSYQYEHLLLLKWLMIDKKAKKKLICSQNIRLQSQLCTTLKTSKFPSKSLLANEIRGEISHVNKVCQFKQSASIMYEYSLCKTQAIINPLLLKLSVIPPAHLTSLSYVRMKAPVKSYLHYKTGQNEAIHKDFNRRHISFVGLEGNNASHCTWDIYNVAK